jgi:crotonobetainyl-CoA:carnitine CoA-transferase CaiB-like acyl-CoA transferase
LKSEAGRELFLRLAAESDLVMENFRPGVVRRLGIDYDSVRAVRPDVLYCSISGFGQTGPYRDRPGFDIMAQGVGGFLRMTGQPDGVPTKVGIAVNDIAAGATAIYSVLAAQMMRERTGVGQYIDISLVDAGLAWTLWEAGAFFGSGEVPAPSGTRHRRSTPYQAYVTSDGFVTIGANNDRLWQRFCRDVVGRPEWIEDPRFVTLSDRMSHIDELQDEIEAITKTRPTEEWVQVCDRAGVPGGPVLTYDETLTDPHVLSRDMVVEMQHPIIGPMRTVGTGARFSGIDYRVRGAAPWLGQHTRQVLAERGLSEPEIDRLFDDGVVFDEHPELQGTNHV